MLGPFRTRPISALCVDAPKPLPLVVGAGKARAVAGNRPARRCRDGFAPKMAENRQKRARRDHLSRIKLILPVLAFTGFRLVGRIS